MRSKGAVRILLTLLGISAIALSAMGRPGPGVEGRSAPPTTSAAAAPAYCIVAHNIGKIALSVTNYGIFGAGATGYGTYIKGASADCFTGLSVPACEYPKGSSTQYLYSGNFWIGAVVGRDTLVSVGADGWDSDEEFNPDPTPFGDMIRRSIIDPSSPEYTDAISEQDFIATYTDSVASGLAGLVQDAIDRRPHRPLHIKVQQNSYAWSYSYAEDFVLFDFGITNIGTSRLTKVYVGLYVDADVGGLDRQVNERADDDVCGFIRDIAAPRVDAGNCSGFRDTVNLAWIADNDGDMDKQTPVTGVTGMRIVRTPLDSLDVSFNWWIGNTTPALDFGPMRTKGAWADSVRDLGTGGKGTPEGDRNKYAFMKNKEFDYDQVYTAAINIDDTTWEYPPQDLARLFAKGYDTRYLLSFGPFQLDPGQTVPLSFAYVAGQGFHTDRTNGQTNLLSGYNPNAWYQNVHFDDIGLNAMWASWIYDNPGYDTRGDGHRGKFRICMDSMMVYDTTNPGPPPVIDSHYVLLPDTLYYEGDNVPDFRGASPPPAPKMWLLPSDGRIIVRFNGTASENTPDIFSRELDFEGYRVYYGLDERPASFSLSMSYDVRDFNKYVYNPNKLGGAGYELRDVPFTLQRLQALYGHGVSDWDPLVFTPGAPYRMPGHSDSVFYFTKQDFNNSRPGIDTRICKLYADAVKPPDSLIGMTADSALANLDSLTLAEYYTADGYLKYYEYVDTLDNLLPTVPYFVNVTAFDFGSPSTGLGSLETSTTVGYKEAYPQGPAEGQVGSTEVYVYPNPYRMDGNYQEDGYEGRDRATRNNAPDRKRRIYFANLPPKCKISIFTIDGDLVKEIDHDMDASDPLSSHDSWDMITRNTQLVVSGLYYWTVESPTGKTQIGKLAIIM